MCSLVGVRKAGVVMRALRLCGFSAGPAAARDTSLFDRSRRVVRAAPATATGGRVFLFAISAGRLLLAALARCTLGMGYTTVAGAQTYELRAVVIVHNREQLKICILNKRRVWRGVGAAGRESTDDRSPLRSQVCNLQHSSCRVRLSAPPHGLPQGARPQEAKTETPSGSAKPKGFEHGHDRRYGVGFGLRSV